MISDREKFCSVLCNGPLLRGDAVVVLCGEDAEPRLAVAFQIFKSGGASTIVLSGGVNAPPRWIGALTLYEKLLGLGVASDRIVVDDEPRHTAHQAANVIERAQECRWGRILLVASPYHQYRAYLTFLKVIQKGNATDTIHIVNVTADQTPWWKAPEGMDTSRIDLLSDEFEKIDMYGAWGHVSTYAEGLEYLRLWEGR